MIRGAALKAKLYAVSEHSIIRQSILLSRSNQCKGIVSFHSLAHWHREIKSISLSGAVTCTSALCWNNWCGWDGTFRLKPQSHLTTRWGHIFLERSRSMVNSDCTLLNQYHSAKNIGGSCLLCHSMSMALFLQTDVSNQIVFLPTVFVHLLSVTSLQSSDWSAMPVMLIVISLSQCDQARFHDGLNWFNKCIFFQSTFTFYSRSHAPLSVPCHATSI